MCLEVLLDFVISVEEQKQLILKIFTISYENCVCCLFSLTYDFFL